MHGKKKKFIVDFIDFVPTTDFISSSACFSLLLECKYMYFVKFIDLY